MTNQEVYDLILNIFFFLVFVPLIGIFFTPEARSFGNDILSFWKRVFAVKKIAVLVNKKLDITIIIDAPYARAFDDLSKRMFAKNSKYLYSVDIDRNMVEDKFKSDGLFDDLRSVLDEGYKTKIIPTKQKNNEIREDFEIIFC